MNKKLNLCYSGGKTEMDGVIVVFWVVTFVVL
jgi:hypothetical protein